MAVSHPREAAIAIYMHYSCRPLHNRRCRYRHTPQDTSIEPGQPHPSRKRLALFLFVQEIVAVDVFHQVVAYLVLRGELQAVLLSR